MGAALRRPSLIHAHGDEATPWVNRVPSWITSDPRYDALGPSSRMVLRLLADACDQPDQAGNLRGGFAGQGLAAAAGVCRKTMWTALRRLEACGFVVLLARGGTVRLRGRTINASNVYGIPGAAGQLDAEAVQHEFRQMLAGVDGVYRPQSVAPGAQATLWRRADVEAASESAPGGAVESPSPPGADSGAARRAKVHSPEAPPGESRVTSRDSAPPRPGGAAPSFATCTPQRAVANHRAARRGTFAPPRPLASSPAPGRPPQMRWQLGEITVEHLRTPELLEAMYIGGTVAGLVEKCEDGKQRWFASAAHALRVGRDPPRLFVANVLARRWDHATQADDDWASERLRELA